MASLLVKVQRKMNIVSHSKVRSALEGEYASIFHGRNTDFDDLREYVPGDEIKDIDWKASARARQILIKRYVAVRKFNIVLVIDTGKSMTATTPSGENKKDVGIMVAGIITAVALKHNDPIGLVAGDSDNISHYPLKDNRAHAERLLKHVDDHTQPASAVSDLSALLESVRHTIKGHKMLILISDSLSFSPIQERLLRRIRLQHELLFIAVDDLDPNSDMWKQKDVIDVDNPTFLPAFVRSKSSVEDAYSAYIRSEWRNTQNMLKKLRINNVRVSSENEVIDQIVRLLEKQKHAKK